MKCWVCLLLLLTTNSVILCSRTPAANQLINFAATHKNGTGRITTSFGTPISVMATMSVGSRGPITLLDVELIDSLAHFVRETIPERRVHAKGSGAFGFFEVTHDITRYTKAAPFAFVGKKTKVGVRFSTVSGGRDSPDTVRGAKGFAIKFYTEDGIWDLVGANIPVVFMRDPITFPNFHHALKKNPATNANDADMMWDFVSQRPELLNAYIRVMTGLGMPDGYRHMNGYGVNTFRLINKSRQEIYARFQLKTLQGLKNLTNDQAAWYRAHDPDYASKDLYNAIATKQYPAWQFSIQLMTPAQMEHLPWDAFDVTKEWPYKDFPLMPVGRLMLTLNPSNYFAEVEQIGFSPAHLIPGIQASPLDRIMQARMFIYSDALRYRLGPNFQQIPVNCPFVETNYQRDGPASVRNSNQQDVPVYYPNSFNGPIPDPSSAPNPFYITGILNRYSRENEDNLSQPGHFFRTQCSKTEQIDIVKNIVSQLKSASGFIRKRIIDVLYEMDNQLGQMINTELSKIQSLPP